MVFTASLLKKTFFKAGKNFRKWYSQLSHNRCDGVVVRASALQSIDLGFISQVESYQKDFCLLGAQQNRDSVENKPASLLVVSLGKALNGIPLSLCGRQVVGPSSLPIVVTLVILRTCKPSVSLTQCTLYIHLPA